MKINADWLQNPALQSWMAALAGHGFACFVVGGAVRNTLMGLPVSDVDLATDAPPDSVQAIAKAAKIRCIPTGLDHGTVTVLLGGAPYEVTTFRRDLASDGRHAQVAFTTDLAADAARRDFTINALYTAADGQVIDPMGGLPDIAARRVRFVGDAGARIREDYLRILRFFRFSAQYANLENGFDAETLAACADHIDGLNRLSKERVGQEMRKLLAAENPATALAAMAATGVLAQILPGADPKFIGPLVHLEGGAPCGWAVRLALMGGENVENQLRLSRAEIADLKILRSEIAQTQSIAALAWLYGEKLARGVAYARAALFLQDLPLNLHLDLARGVQAICPISAADLMPRLEGPALGRALAAATKRWLQSDLRAQKADLL